MKQKRWRCTVCNYIHTGDNPPDICPECGVGPEFFEFLDEIDTSIDENTQKLIQNTLFKIQYGLFIVASQQNNNLNGQVCNTVFQVTSSPITIATGINKSNLTHSYIQSSGSFSVSVLGSDCLDEVKLFGYQSGRDVNKFKEIDYYLTPSGNPVIKNSVAYFDCIVLKDKVVDLGTHTLFIAEVTSAKIISEEIEPITYSKYRKLKNSIGKNKTKTKIWQCEVCGYTHEGDTPPDKCPICGVGPEKFFLL